MANPAIVKQSLTLPDFTELGARKLAELQANGYRITGYCFERQVEGTQPQRGFVDFAGFVGWWRPTTQITGAPNVNLMGLINELADADADPTNQELRWCGSCGEGVTFFCRSKTICECPRGLGRVTAHGVADMKGGQDVENH